MPDIVIVGGGVIGLSLAWELAGEGLQVSVLDQSELGREASWAGAGMIPPGDLHHSATHRLAVLSLQRWPEITAALASETGIDNGYRRCGGLLLGTESELEHLAQEWSDRSVMAEKLSTARLHSITPKLNAELSSGVWLPEMAQVRNPRHLTALKAACRLRGVKLLPGQKVVSWETRDNRILAARTQNEQFSAAEFVVATGAWTQSLMQLLGRTIPIEPVHGQIVLLRGSTPLFNQVIEQGNQYLVPRNDGRVLIGATEDRVGFEKFHSPEVTEKLVAFARSIIPSLAELPVEKVWSGLRPWSALKHPSLGRVPEIDNIFLAAGHFRAGLSNSPGTALVMRQLILDEPPTIDLSELGC